MKPHDHEECCCCCHDAQHEHHHNATKHEWKEWIPMFVSLVLFGTACLLDYSDFPKVFTLTLYGMAYLPVGAPVWKHAIKGICKGDWFNEFILMAVATVGAFCIGEYTEGVAVMLFYTLGEMFQERAVKQARHHIDNLLDMKEQKVEVWRNEQWEITSPEQILVGETIRLCAGNQVPLDGILLTEKGRFNTAALTGESTPQSKTKGACLMAGMINEEHVVTMQVTHRYEDSARARILELVHEARARKSHTELLIRRLARIYTPVVFVAALLVAFVPPLLFQGQNFTEWIYRALVFLVISCPCALVISIPLAYFSGIGVASKYGILFKGANFLDSFAHLKTIVFDKTGTLTYGDFNVVEVHMEKDAPKDTLAWACSLEQTSSHPIAKAVAEYAKKQNMILDVAEDVREIAGKGLKGYVGGHFVEVGNMRLLSDHQIEIPASVSQKIETIVFILVDQVYCGYLLIADRIKEDAAQTIALLKKSGIDKTIMLSGDKQQLAEKVGKNIGIDVIHGDLLPEDKMKHIEHIKQACSDKMAYVGDGINDTPALALSSIGIAMGKNGSEAAVETADVVLQTDHPTGIVTALRISKATKSIVLQNITLALGVKIIVLTMGVWGIANMWSAVFADVGVALLAVLNAIRLLHKNFLVKQTNI